MLVKRRPSLETEGLRAKQDKPGSQRKLKGVTSHCFGKCLDHEYDLNFSSDTHWMEYDVGDYYLMLVSTEYYHYSMSVCSWKMSPR